jgi:hypothetical protein
MTDEQFAIGRGALYAVARPAVGKLSGDQNPELLCKEAIQPRAARRIDCLTAEIHRTR